MNPVSDPAAQIPTDNPFFATASGKNRLIWTLGLRNPFTFSIQPGTGLTFVNDVGEVTFEEIDDARPGRNFGWPTTEGRQRRHLPSVHESAIRLSTQQRDPTGCAITGGAFYTDVGSDVSGFLHREVFLRRLLLGLDLLHRSRQPIDRDAVCCQRQLASRPQARPDGGLYYLARGAGSVGKIVPSGSGLPQITQQPANRTVAAGATATFTVTASGTAPLWYQWQKNGVDIPTATTALYTTLPTVLADTGSTYRCRGIVAVGARSSRTVSVAASPSSIGRTATRHR